MQWTAVGGGGGVDPEAAIEAAAAARRARARRRARIALAVPVAITVVWLVYVTAAGQWGRVAANWEAALTMVFGSIVGGATPQGGGAVAFPAFTKVLQVPSDVARSFSLCIQAVGMGTAAAAIIINRRRIEWRAVAAGGAAALVGFGLSMVLVADPSRPYWPSRLPADYVRVTFTLVLIGMAFVVYLGTKVLIRKLDAALPPMNARLYATLIVTGLLGGLASALTGSGADVLLYLVVVVLIGIDPRVGVPSSVVVMAGVSVVGFVLLALVDGQLSVMLSDGSAGHVVSVGGEAVSGRSVDGSLVPVAGAAGASLPASRFDLFGMWIAATPVVAWGGSVGSWLASRMKARQLVFLTLSLAVLEAVSTAIFLTELHRPGGLLAYAIVGLVTVLGGMYLLARYRRIIFRLPGLTLEESLDRGHLDVVPGYEEQLESDT